MRECVRVVTTRQSLYAGANQISSKVRAHKARYRGTGDSYREKLVSWTYYHDHHRDGPNKVPKTLRTSYARFVNACVYSQGESDASMRTS
jgi:hypothetical protein